MALGAKEETGIVQACLKWLTSEAVGGDGYHVHGSILQRGGEPDIDGSIPDGKGGHIHFKCEVKVPGQKPDPLQQHRLEQYRLRGYLAFWVVSLEEFKRALGH